MQDSSMSDGGVSNPISSVNLIGDSAKTDDHYKTSNSHSLSRMNDVDEKDSSEDQLRSNISLRLAKIDGLEEIPYIDSTHKILFKISDYASFPKRKLRSWDSFKTILIGSRRKDIHGNFHPEDQSRLLFIFHDLRSLYLLFFAGFLFAAQFLSLVFIFSDALNLAEECTDTISTYPLILCVLFAAAQATEDLYDVLPFELVGVSREEYCLNVSRANFKGQRASSTFWFDTIKEVFSTVDLKSERGRQEKLQSIVDFGLLCSAVVPTLFLVVNNIYLVITIGVIMGGSPDIITLVQNFVSVEILVHAPEMIAKIMRIRDRSPDRFNKSWRETIAEMERVQAIPTYLKNKDGTDGRRARVSYQQFTTLVFLSYCTCIFAVYLGTIIKNGCNPNWST